MTIDKRDCYLCVYHRATEEDCYCDSGDDGWNHVDYCVSASEKTNLCTNFKLEPCVDGRRPTAGALVVPLSKRGCLLRVR